MKEAIQQALEVLRKGGIILYPTDTVWGIGCDATDPEAVAKIYAVKKREDSKSLVLLARDEENKVYTKLNVTIPADAVEVKKEDQKKA